MGPLLEWMKPSALSRAEPVMAPAESHAAMSSGVAIFQIVAMSGSVGVFSVVDMAETRSDGVGVLLRDSHDGVDLPISP